MEATLRARLYEIAVERGLRQTTVRSYETLLARMGLLDETEPSLERLQQALWTIDDNANTRRAAVIALRSITGHRIKIPKAVPRRYDLPNEDTLRLALMTSPHETRGLLMMYAGLRVGEACAITRQDAHDDQINVTKQVIEVFEKGKPTIRRLAQVKTSESGVIAPRWLVARVTGLESTVSPGSVRESLRRAGLKVGIRLNPHQLRHWYATESLRRGIPLPLVSKQLDIRTLPSHFGHMSISSAKIFTTFGVDAALSHRFVFDTRFDCVV